jgi:hypothetical protein
MRTYLSSPSLTADPENPAPRSQPVHKMNGLICFLKLFPESPPEGSFVSHFDLVVSERDSRKVKGLHKVLVSGSCQDFHL